MRFRYAFQKVVDLKNSEKMQAEWILSQAIGVLTEEQSHLSQLHDEMQKVQQHVVCSFESKTTVSDLTLSQHYLNHLEKQIHLQHHEVQIAQQTVCDQQDHLSMRVLEEKVWNKAKEKAFQQFTAVIRKKEQNELDEIATMRFKRT